MATDGCVISSFAKSREENDSLISPSLLETRNLKGKKSRLCWSGTFEELIDFGERHLDIKGNLVPRVLGLFGQRVNARRDSGIIDCIFPENVGSGLITYA